LILWKSSPPPESWSSSSYSLSGCSFLGCWLSKYLRMRSSRSFKVSSTLGGPSNFLTSTFGGFFQGSSRWREELLGSFSVLDRRELLSRWGEWLLDSFSVLDWRLRFSKYLRMLSFIVSSILRGPLDFLTSGHPDFLTSTFGGLFQGSSRRQEELLGSFSVLDRRELPSIWGEWLLGSFSILD